MRPKPRNPLALRGLALAALVSSVPAQAADTAGTEQALKTIAEFADRYCKNPDLSGKSTNVEVSGEVSVAGVIRKIINLGLKGGAKYQTAEYQGLLQKDFAAALKDTSNCREKVWDGLYKKLLEPSFPPANQTSVKKPQLPADEFLIAGMQVSCTIPVSFSPSFVSTREAIRTSTSEARIVAAGAVQYLLINTALERGETSAGYECSFDDPNFYARVTPLEAKPPRTSASRCRSYRITWIDRFSQGRRVTAEDRACLNVSTGYWETLRQ